MTARERADGELFVEGVALSEIAARFGTPCFVYSRAALESAYREFDAAFAALRHLTCYALKANPNLAILDIGPLVGIGDNANAILTLLAALIFVAAHGYIALGWRNMRLSPRRKGRLTRARFYGWPLRRCCSWQGSAYGSQRGLARF